MYTTNPEDYLQTRGLMIKPEEKKHEIEEVKAIAEIEDKKWRSCCFSLHQESSLFFAKLTISVMIIALCSYQLISLQECQFQSLYSSILSSVFTFWLSKSK